MKLVIVTRDGARHRIEGLNPDQAVELASQALRQEGVVHAVVTGTEQEITIPKLEAMVKEKHPDMKMENPGVIGIAGEVQQVLGTPLGSRAVLQVCKVAGPPPRVGDGPSLN